MANEFIARNGLISQNNSTITGSLTVTGGITGSLFGTASYAIQALSASYIPTLQQVIDSGKTVVLPDDTGGITITMNDTQETYGLAAIKAISGAYGDAIYAESVDGVAIHGYSISTTGVKGGTVGGTAVAGYSQGNGLGVYGYSLDGNAIYGYSGNEVAGVLNMAAGNTSNIAEFKKDSVNQAYITYNGTIVSNKSLINTTVDNGIDKLQVSGSTNLNGNATITGSIKVNGSITGSLFGTASYAIQALSASYAPFTTPTLQQVSDAGKTVTYPSGVTGMFINVDDQDAVDNTGLTVAATGTAIGINSYSDYGTAIVGTSITSSGVIGGSVNSVGVIGSSENSIGVYAYSSTNTALVANIPTGNTSNIAEFKKNSINQAYITHDGIIVSNTSIINTTVNNGVDKLQVSGSTNLNGNTRVTGSLRVTAGITGSLSGTSSWARNALTSSFLASTTNAFIQGGNSFGTAALFGTNDNQSLALETSGSTRMFISSNGSIGIGKINPTKLLDVNGDVLINGLTVGRGSGDDLSNILIGSDAFISNTTGINNTVNGYSALKFNTTGNQNTANGTFALSSNTTGDSNTANGRSALRANTTGSNNVAFGSDAGRYIANKTSTATSLSNSVMIGNTTSPLANNQTNQIVIGDNATGLGSNTTVLGNSSTLSTAIYGDLLVGQTTDNGTDKLQITGTSNLNGNTRITGSLRGFVSASTVTSSTASIDFSKSNFFTVALVNGVNTHISGSNVQPGQTTSIRVTQGSLGTGTVTFSNIFKQPSGSAYTASAVNNAVDILSLISFDSSTTYTVNVKNLI